ncbi:MAG: Mur ligase domain-containing protein [Bacteroidales bacterium]|nr:Mur ligase domain-containing protein [Bacteroidales bacterium]
MKVHFIAIGGSAMHNLAIALHLKGYQVTGSDDEIFEPAKGRLAKYGILPDSIGWHPERITPDLDAIILGMHARIDNPELLRAKELGLKIYSYPEYLYEQSKDKTRIVIGGSHGKTTITSMIIHVLQQNHIDCDYMVGAQLDGFEVMVKLSEDAPIMVIEGDEYLTSPIDRRPKFHVYQPTIGIVSGIAWDHINVFPTFDIYVKQFEIFANMIPENGKFIYCEDDAELPTLATKVNGTTKQPYGVHPYHIEDGVTYLETPYGEFPLQIFGRHNLTNLNAARYACAAVGVSELDFYKAISTFKGASKRLELVACSGNCAVYKDFAHSPSKLKATISAVREQFPNRRLIACMELHTFSSLTEAFLAQYAGAMDAADTAIVYFSPEAIRLKKLPPISSEMIMKAFGRADLLVYNDSKLLKEKLLAFDFKDAVFLMMSSGDFNGINVNELGEKIISLRA